MKMAVFWVVVPCSSVEVHPHFRGVERPRTSVTLDGTKAQKTAIFKKLFWLMLVFHC
jgi:hypothetical protein